MTLTGRQKKYKKENSQTPKRKSEYAKQWKESLKERGLYDRYLAYRREWAYRKRHNIKGKVNFSIPRKIEPRSKREITESVKGGNEKWSELEKKEYLWRKYRNMIPTKLLNSILSDDYYNKCCRHKEGTCKGRVTFEHAIIFAGKQVQEKFAIIPLCEYHHDVLTYQDKGELNKEINVLVALNRASDLEISSISKAINYTRLRDYLREKYPNYAREGI